MPEIAAMGALERLDVMLNDAIYGILFRDINMQRTLVDQFFSRVIIGYCGIIFNSGEDNYLTTDDAYESAHTVTASQFINEQFAVLANIQEWQMGLGHAFEMDPSMKDGFLYELSQAIMDRVACGEFIGEKIKRDVVVVGASTGSDAHTVGIDAIIQMKGFHGHFGLERFKNVVAINMGSQVPNEELIAKAKEINADAILVSQTVTQKDIHIKNLTNMNGCIELRISSVSFAMIHFFR